MAKNNGLILKIGGQIDSSLGKALSTVGKMTKAATREATNEYKASNKEIERQIKNQQSLTKSKEKAEGKQQSALRREEQLTDELKQQIIEAERLAKLKEDTVNAGWQSFIDPKKQFKLSQTEAALAEKRTSYENARGLLPSHKTADIRQFVNGEAIKEAHERAEQAIKEKEVQTELANKIQEQLDKEKESLRINQDILKEKPKNKKALEEVAKAEGTINELLKLQEIQQEKVNKAAKKQKTAKAAETRLRNKSPLKQEGKLDTRGANIIRAEQKLAFDKDMLNVEAQKKYENELNKIDTAQKKVDKSTQKLNAQISEAQTTYSNAGEDAEEYGKRIEDAANKEQAAAASAKTALQNIASNMVLSAFNKLAGVMNKISSSLIKLGAKAVKTIGKLAGVLESTTSKAMSLQKAIRLVVQYGFGFRSLYYLVRRLRSAIKEGFEYLGGIQKSAKKAFSGASEEIHKLIESLQKLMYYLKSAAAAMLAPFAPLINTIIPRLISLFDSLSYAVARFVATLTGSKTIFKATTDLDAYANALDKTSGSAKAAKQSLAAFDDINVLDKGSSGSGSGGAELDTSDWFTEETFEPSTLAELIKAAWEKADFTEVGDYIGQRFSEMLNNINWDDIVTKAGNIGKSVRTFIKGLISVDNLGTDIGEAVAGIFNSIANFLYEYATDDEYWTNLGQFFADGLQSLFRNLDAKHYGEAVHNLVAGVMTAISTALENPEESWISTFGEKLGDFLAGLDLKDLASKLLNLAKQIAAGISEVLQSWAEQDPDSFGIAKALMLSVVGLKVGSGAFALLGQILGSTMTGYFAQLGASADGVIGVIGKLGTAFSGLFSTLAASPITWIIVGIVALIAALKLLYDNNEGFRKQVDDFFARIKKDVSNIWNNVLKPLWDNLKELFSSIWEGILKPLILAIAERAAPVIMTVLDGIWTAISTVVKFVGQHINDVIVVLKGLVDFIAGIFSGDIDKALQGLQGMFGGLFNGIFHIVEGIVNAVIDAVNWCIRSLNRFLGGIKIPDWDILPAAIRGKSLGDWLNIQEIPHVTLTATVSSANTLKNKTRGRGEIAALASGAVIPPNREFLALLGDQTSGTNIEAPLDTIVEAMQIALNNSGYADREIVMQIDGSEFARLTVPNNLKEMKRKGYNVKLLGV